MVAGASSSIATSGSAAPGAWRSSEANSDSISTTGTGRRSPRPHAEALAQGARHGGHGAQVLGVGEAASVVADEVLRLAGAAGAEARRRLEQRAERARPLAEDGHALAEDGLLDHLEGPARAGEA